MLYEVITKERAEDDDQKEGQELDDRRDGEDRPRPAEHVETHPGEAISDSYNFV